MAQIWPKSAQKWSKRGPKRAKKGSFWGSRDPQIPEKDPFLAKSLENNVDFTPEFGHKGSGPLFQGPKMTPFLGHIWGPF
jgi:hypothetical protein